MKTINIYKKRMTVAASFLMAAMLLLMTGCKEDTATSVNDNPPQGGPKPVIESVVSSHGTAIFGGLSTLTITGKNFSSNPGQNFVYLDAVKAPVLSESPTQLTVSVPLYIKDSVRINIFTSKGSDHYNDPYYINIVAAVTEYGGFSATEEATSITSDKLGNVYVTMKASNIAVGIRKYIVGPDTGYQYDGAAVAWSGMKIGPDGKLYGARNRSGIFQLPAANTVWAATASVSFSDFDFDSHGFIWGGGNSPNIAGVNYAAKTATAFPSGMTNVRCVRVYNDYVYLAGKKDTIEGVWRLPITGNGSVGALELYFNLSKLNLSEVNGTSTLPGTANAITFNTDGEMYLATNMAVDPVILVAPGGQSYQTYYPGLITGPLISLAWGSNSMLYAVRGGNDVLSTTKKALVKINTVKVSAPYYGIQ